MLSQLSAKVSFKGLAVAVLSSTLLACASNPDNIDAAYVSAFKYEPYSCEQIAFELGLWHAGRKGCMTPLEPLDAKITGRLGLGSFSCLPYSPWKEGMEYKHPNMPS